MAIWDIDADSATTVAKSITEAGGQAEAFEVDITDELSVVAAGRRSSRLGACPYLVNNAGVASSRPLSMAEGLAGTIGGLVAVTEKWLETVGDEASSVVNISSIAGNDVGARIHQHLLSCGQRSDRGLHTPSRGAATGRPRANTVSPGFTLTPRSAPLLDKPGTAFA